MPRVGISWERHEKEVQLKQELSIDNALEYTQYMHLIVES